jgi:hypothetical protein
MSNIFIVVSPSNGQIFTDAKIGDVLFYTGSNSQTYRFGNSNSNVPYLTMTSNAVHFTRSVGIGKSNPAYPLDVNGIINATNLYVGGAPYIGSQWANSNNIVYLLGSNVGIGLSNPSYPLHVIGDIYATGNVAAFSDCNFKTNLEKITDPLEKLQYMSGYTYSRVDIPEEFQQRYTGLLAQDVEQVLPEAICRDNDGRLSISYGNMAGFFVEALKALTNEVIELKRELADLRSYVSMKA